MMESFDIARVGIREVYRNPAASATIPSRRLNFKLRHYRNVGEAGRVTSDIIMRTG